MTQIRSVLLTTACLTLLVPSLGRACINDTDTVEFELKNMNLLEEIKQTKRSTDKRRLIGDLIIRAASGRFERYPKKYYEMRIAALEKEPKLDAYSAEDLAVAYDRIGDSKSAMRVIRASLPQRKPGSEEMYRFHANYGTFIAHNWFKGGAKKSEVSQLDEAAAQIESGLKIRPDAHFGRERVQLQLLRFVAAHTRGTEKLPLYNYLNQTLTDHEIAIGLCGLVMMGAAYESPDVFAAITQTGYYVSESGRRVARYRAAELLKTRKPISDFFDEELNELLKDKQFLTRPNRAARLYSKVRQDGEKVHQKRTAYMLARLNRGEHPDWTEEFWSDWEEPPYLVLEKEKQGPIVRQADYVPLGAAGLMLLATGFYVRERIVTRRKAKLPTK